jgi:hypothetical protein
MRELANFYVTYALWHLATSIHHDRLLGVDIM